MHTTRKVWPFDKTILAISAARRENLSPRSLMFSPGMVGASRASEYNVDWAVFQGLFGSVKAAFKRLYSQKLLTDTDGDIEGLPAFPGSMEHS